MTREEAIAIIENEKECVNRANKNDYCNRDCYNCELVKTDTEILTALDMAIKALERQSENAVSRQAAIDALGEKPLSWTEDEYEFGLQNQWQSDVDAIKALPSAQPERKKGKWRDHQEGDWIYAKCSLCGAVQDNRSNFCPNCGAEMEGEEENNE